jgi:hypothetical protein
VRDRILAFDIRRLRVAVHQVERPVGAGRVFVWHADATRVEHALPCDRTLELRVRVTADDDRRRHRRTGQRSTLPASAPWKMSTSLRVSAGRFVWHCHIVEHEDQRDDAAAHGWADGVSNLRPEHRTRYPSDGTSEHA